MWAGQAVLPLGFALITLRLAWSAAGSWPARAATLLLAAGVALAAAIRLPLTDGAVTAAIGLVLRRGGCSARRCSPRSAASR